MNIIISLFIGTFIGFITAACISMGKIEDLERAIYSIKKKIDLISDLRIGMEDTSVNRIINEIKGIVEVFYNGN